jgi:hypothetical protein
VQPARQDQHDGRNDAIGCNVNQQFDLGCEMLQDKLVVAMKGPSSRLNMRNQNPDSWSKLTEDALNVQQCSILEGDTPTERREGLVVFEKRAEQGKEFGDERAF